MRLPSLIFLLVSAGTAACASGPVAPAAPGVDGGGAEASAGGKDAGGPSDSGEQADTGGFDAVPPVDAGPVRVDVPAVTCEDAVDQVYVTPTGMPPMTNDLRGTIVRCAPDQGYSLADAQSALTGKSITMTATSGANIFRILFRTTRADGSAAVSSARVYLPTAPRATPLPVIAIGHPSEGISDGCTPSKTQTSYQDLALPWAALGYAAIVPDYAGLGTDGIQAYLDNTDTAHSLLDGARALRKLLPARALSSKVVLFGYSQGGGAALSGQALEKAYGADGQIVGVVAFAPQWPTRLNSFGYVDILNNPSGLTIGSGLSKSAIAVLREYAYFGNRVAGATPADGFPSAKRQALGQAVDTTCLVPLGGYIQVMEPTLGDLIDDTLRTSLLACIGSNGVGCAEPGASYYAFLTGNVLTADKTGAPVLMIQGLADQIMLPAEEAACTIDKLVSEGVTPDVCVDAAATHETVVARNVLTGIGWAQSKIDGTAAPSCSSVGMPSCTP